MGEGVMTNIDTITASRICFEVAHLIRTAKPDIVKMLWAELDRIRAESAETATAEVAEAASLQVQGPQPQRIRTGGNDGNYPRTSLDKLFARPRR